MTRLLPPVPGQSERRAGHRRGSTQVAAALASVDFPATKQEIQRRAGDARIEVAPGRTLPLARILEETPGETFPTFSEAQNAINAHWGVYARATQEEGEESPEP